MASVEERVSRLEGVLEQMNERLGRVELDLRNKVDKWEFRLWAGLVLALLAALFGAVLSRG